MNNYTPRPGSAAEHAVEYIRKNGGTARSKEIAAEIGIEQKNVSASLAAAVENGLLIACDIVVPGTPSQKEYRISGGGAPMQWRQPKPATLSPGPSPTGGRGEKAAAPAAGKPARRPYKPRKPAQPTQPHPRDADRAEAAGKPLRAAAKVQRKNAKPARVMRVMPEIMQPGCAFRCGVFSDGSLVLRLRDGSLAELPPDDTRALCDYLDRTLDKAAA